MDCISSGVSFIFGLSDCGRSTTNPVRQKRLIVRQAVVFMNIKMTSNSSNIDTSFRHATYSAAVVSGSLLQFHIPKCWQRALTPPDTWSLPKFGTCIYVLLVETNPFPELVVFFFRTVRFEHPSVLSRFRIKCMLLANVFCPLAL